MRLLSEPEALPPPGLKRYADRVARLDTVRMNGRVVKVIGLVIESVGPPAMVGELCRIDRGRLKTPIPAEVVGFQDHRVLLMPLGEMDGIRAGSEVVATRAPFRVAVGNSLLGRVLNGLGEPMDGKGPIADRVYRSVAAAPPDSLVRPRITRPLTLGIRSIDACITIGRGQRVGIFAGSGVGKSTVLGMIARNTDAEVNVIALCGERGREVRDFIEDSLGPEGLRRSVVVAATSDQPPLIRIKSALVATAIAEHFRDQGRDVLLMMDSVTRLALAQREVGLAIGEPPATRGYTPSVFSLLPRLLERSGTSPAGTITGLYTVLVEGDDMNEPVADTVRGILDGHVVLDRRLAQQNHYPAVDVLQSVSRLMTSITDEGHRRAAGELRSLLATYRDAEDLINIGAYVPGSNPQIDRARALYPAIKEFLLQQPHERHGFEETVARLRSIFEAPSDTRTAT